MKYIATLIFALLAAGRLSAQVATSSEALSQPEGVCSALLTPRSALLCYPSRAQLEGAKGSDFISELDSWQKSEVENGVSYTTRFKRNFKLDDKEIVLRVEGASGAFAVSVNDKEVGYTSSGAGRTEFDLTKALQPNNNTITITLFNDYAAREIEPSGVGEASEPTFRKASILTPPRVAVADFVASTTFNQRGEGVLNLDVVMQSFLLNSKVYEIYYELYSPDGVKVASGQKELTTRMLSRDTVNFYARIPEVKVWSPEQPNLYNVVVYTKHQKRLREFTSHTIGFRTAELGVEGDLVVNGKPVELKICDIEGLESSAEELQRIKDEGYNMVRPLRPQADEFYALCDRIGLMVCPTADITSPGNDLSSSPSNNPRWKSAYLWRTMDSYHSTKLHPSVVMFSLGHDAQNGICLYESYLAMKALERESRPFVYPDAGGEWNTDL
jgi:beta-galactosidase